MIPLSTRRVLSNSRPISPADDLQRVDPARPLRRIQNLSPAPRGIIQFSDSAFIYGFSVSVPGQFVTTRAGPDTQKNTKVAKALTKAETQLALLNVEHQNMLMKSNIHNLKKSISSRSSSRRSSSHPSAESTSREDPVLPNLDVSHRMVARLLRTRHGGNMRHDRYCVPVAHLPELRRIRGGRNPFEHTSGGSIPGGEEQTAKRCDARTAPRGGARNAVNAKRSGRPTEKREPNARRNVPNAGRSEPWPHSWRQSAGELSTASAQHSKNSARSTGLRGPMTLQISQLSPSS